MSRQETSLQLVRTLEILRAAVPVVTLVTVVTVVTVVEVVAVVTPAIFSKIFFTKTVKLLWLNFTRGKDLYYHF